MRRPREPRESNSTRLPASILAYLQNAKASRRGDVALFGSLLIVIQTAPNCSYKPKQIRRGTKTASRADEHHCRQARRNQHHVKFTHTYNTFVSIESPCQISKARTRLVPKSGTRLFLARSRPLPSAQRFMKPSKRRHGHPKLNP